MKIACLAEERTLLHFLSQHYPLHKETYPSKPPAYYILSVGPRAPLMGTRTPLLTFEGLDNAVKEYLNNAVNTTSPDISGETDAAFKKACDAFYSDFLRQACILKDSVAPGVDPYMQIICQVSEGVCLAGTIFRTVDDQSRFADYYVAEVYITVDDGQLFGHMEAYASNFHATAPFSPTVH